MITTEILFAKEKVTCDETEYTTRVRNEIEDYKQHVENVGNIELTDHCQSELDRLDEEFDYQPQN